MLNTIRVFSVLFLVLIPAVGFSASPTLSSFESFSAEVEIGGTSIHVVSPEKGYIFVSVNDLELNVTVAGRVGDLSPGTVEFTVYDSSGIRTSATLMMADAESNNFQSISLVANLIGPKAARRIAESTLIALDSGRIPRTGAHFLLAAVGALATQQSVDGQELKAAWPWDYGAYSICYYACVIGGGGWQGCGPYCHALYLG